MSEENFIGCMGFLARVCKEEGGSIRVFNGCMQKHDTRLAEVGYTRRQRIHMRQKAREIFRAL